MSMVWLGWDPPVQKAAFSAFVYFELAQNKRSLVVANNKRCSSLMKNVVGTPSSYKQRGSIMVRSLCGRNKTGTVCNYLIVETNRLVGIGQGRV